MKFTPSTSDDIEQLTEWIQADPYHKDCLNPNWWLTGHALLSFCLQDSKGPLCYVRLDAEGENIRIHTQFAPENEVPKLRLVKGMLGCIPVVLDFAKSEGLTGAIFKSVSPSLIEFMHKKYGFEFDKDDDYVLKF